MARILVINPNRSADCTAGIDAAIARFRYQGGPAIDVVDLPESCRRRSTRGRDWHAVVEPLLPADRTAEAADLYVIACAPTPASRPPARCRPAGARRRPRRGRGRGGARRAGSA